MIIINSHFGKPKIFHSKYYRQKKISYNQNIPKIKYLKGKNIARNFLIFKNYLQIFF